MNPSRRIEFSADAQQVLLVRRQELWYDAAVVWRGEVNFGSAMSHHFAQTIRARRGRNGFSLIELLIVLTIISILSTISISMLAGLTSSNHLNEAAANVQGQFELARQTARTLNRSVQLRFYRDQSNSIGTSIDTLQIVVPAENSSLGPDQPVEKPIALPPGVIVADGSSDLLLTAFTGSSGPTFEPFNPALPSRYTTSYILTFAPSGAITATDNTGASVYPSTNGSTVYWSVSLVPQNQYRANGSSMSGLKNYATLYLNSVNGTGSCVRP